MRRLIECHVGFLLDYRKFRFFYVCALHMRAARVGTGSGNRGFSTLPLAGISRGKLTQGFISPWRELKLCSGGDHGVGGLW